MDTPRPKFQLSDRETSLIQLASTGATDTAIAHKLGISEATVGTYWGRIRIKLGPYSRTELVAIVLRTEQAEALKQLRDENAQLVQQLQTAILAPGADEHYKSLIEHAPDAMILVAADGTILSGNEAAHDLFGYEPGRLEGQQLTELIPHELREVHQIHRQEYLRDPKRRAMGEHEETPALHKDGSQFFIRATLSSIETPRGLIVICALRKHEDQAPISMS